MWHSLTGLNLDLNSWEAASCLVRIQASTIDYVLLYCEAQAKDRQGMQDGEWWKALKLKPLPKAYTKVGCHTHPPPASLILLN